MSRHHQAQNWSTHSPKLRVKLAAMLPLPCVDCGRLVTPDQKWQVGHRTAAAQGGQPTMANVGPSHVKSDTWPRSCNQKAGGKLGAAIANRSKLAAKRTDQGIRPW